MSMPMTQEQPRYSSSLTASYELDLWGKLTAGRSAAKADYLASAENLRALTISMSAQIARSYYLVAELRQQRDLLDQSVSSYQDSYNLVLSRYQRGVVSSQDVYQAKTYLAGAMAQRAVIESNLRVAGHSLAILLGRYPECGIVPADTVFPGSTSKPIPGLPGDLINRRPDVRGAYMRLVAADKRSAEAVAARLPSFNLTGSISGSSDAIQEITNPENMIWTAIGNITMPLFQGGKLKANADRAEAVWREQLANYKATVLNAYKEVENALVKSKLLLEYQQKLEEQVSAAESTLRLANQNYLRGVTNYLNVVTAQTAYFSARSNLIAAQSDFIDVHIDLAVSLGGGWTNDVIDRYMLTDN